MVMAGEPERRIGPVSRGPDAEGLRHLRAALADLGLIDPRPVLVLVGGASNIAPAVADALLDIFRRLAPLLDGLGITLVDGGTAFGVMAAMGQARQDLGASFPLIGVAARGTVSPADPPTRWVQVMPDPGPGDSAVGEGARLDPNHSHLILVPGDQWGDESPWIDATAACLADGCPTLTLVAAGGRITRLDVLQGLGSGRPLIVIAGTGGVADEIADWCRDGRAIPDLPLTDAERPLIEVVDLAVASERLAVRLTRTFSA